MLKTIEMQGAYVKIVRILLEIYKNAKAYVKFDQKGSIFPVQTGVKQGDPLSSYF